MKSNRAIMMDKLDKAFLAIGEELTVDDAQEINLSEELDLSPSLVTLLFFQRRAHYLAVAPAQFLSEYVAAKFDAFAHGDKGARGDAIEAVVRFHLKKRFISYSDVMTQTAKKTDISTRFGKVEVGHNGKTFQSAYVPASMAKGEFTAQNYMNGNYTVLIYGAFRKDFSAEDLLSDKLLRTMRVFVNKYQFPEAIAGKHGLASGWNVAHERATVQYSDALRIRFTDYCKANNIPTLGEFLSEAK